MKYMAQHIDTTLSEVPLDWVPDVVRCVWVLPGFTSRCHALNQLSIKASAKQINNAIKWKYFFSGKLLLGMGQKLFPHVLS